MLLLQYRNANGEAHMREKTVLTPTARDVGREVIYLPEGKYATLRVVHTNLCRIQLYGHKDLSIVHINNLQLTPNWSKKDSVREKTRPVKDSTSKNNSTEGLDRT
jgi:hypothetical protein